MPATGFIIARRITRPVKQENINQDTMKRHHILFSENNIGITHSQSNVINLKYTKQEFTLKVFHSVAFCMITNK